jgi:hypothetical protein
VSSKNCLMILKSNRRSFIPKVCTYLWLPSVTCDIIIFGEFFDCKFNRARENECEW